MVSFYCDVIKKSTVENDYHDYEYGFPLSDDNKLFGRLILEINQAGLSWITILKKKENFKAAYNNFEINKIAQYGDVELTRLLADPGIIRNRLKIAATIENARIILKLIDTHGSFRLWLDNYHPQSLGDWVKLFRANFKFMGPEIVREFLVSIGYLAGAHKDDCPIYNDIAILNPPWMQYKDTY